MQKILKLAKELEQARADINRMKAMVEPFEEKKAKIQEKLMEEMKKSEIKSIKTNTNNYSLTVKKDIKVVNEKAVMDSLDKKYYDILVTPRLNTLDFKKYAKNILKETGEVFEGTELTEAEYISIKSVKDDK